MVEINKNQYTCHSGYVGLPALRSPVAPIAARILSSNAGERDPRANAECGNWRPSSILTSLVIHKEILTQSSYLSSTKTYN